MPGAARSSGGWRARPPARTSLSATIIDCGASAWIEQYYDRMPVLPPPTGFDTWLSAAAGIDLLKCAPYSVLQERPVGTRLNRAEEGDDDPWGNRMFGLVRSG